MKTYIIVLGIIAILLVASLFSVYSFKTARIVSISYTVSQADAQDNQGIVNYIGVPCVADNNFKLNQEEK